MRKAFIEMDRYMDGEQKKEMKGTRLTGQGGRVPRSRGMTTDASSLSFSLGVVFSFAALSVLFFFLDTVFFHEEAMG